MRAERRDERRECGEDGDGGGERDEAEGAFVLAQGSSLSSLPSREEVKKKKTKDEKKMIDCSFCASGAGHEEAEGTMMNAGSA